MKVLIVFGTRPEAIKMAPIIRELRKRRDELAAKVCVTAQHREMLDEVLRLFCITPDYDLDVMEENQSPAHVMSGVLNRLEGILQKEKPDWVLVQGDTTTVAAASMAAFYNRVQIGHVEAGLRTYDKWHPYPEEVNRRIVSITADLHFAPTEWARQNLVSEGISKDRILVTGNPVIDALLWVRSRPPSAATSLCLDRLGLSTNGKGNRKLALATAHRRESFGEPLRHICLALRELATRYQELQVIYSVHRNPNVWNPVHELLGRVSNIVLVPPLNYEAMVHVMKLSSLILTDSGGIQEEAPSLGVPVLVLREVTERPEGVEDGTATLVGTEQERIIREASRLLENPSKYARLTKAANPYGDGHAAERIVAGLLRWEAAED
ncbi:MAG: non-hydrolyzing UDP-N-acetylglucosamine 2-epimerase [Candidatus Binatia bacterium]